MPTSKQKRKARQSRALVSAPAPKAVSRSARAGTMIGIAVGTFGVLAGAVGLFAEWEKVPTISPPAASSPSSPGGVPMTVTNPSALFAASDAQIECRTFAGFTIYGQPAADRFSSTSRAADIEPGETIPFPCPYDSAVTTSDGARFPVELLVQEVTVNFETSVGPVKIRRRTRPATFNWVKSGDGNYHWVPGKMKF